MDMRFQSFSCASSVEQEDLESSSSTRKSPGQQPAIRISERALAVGQPSPCRPYQPVTHTLLLSIFVRTREIVEVQLQVYRMISPSSTHVSACFRVSMGTSSSEASCRTSGSFVMKPMSSWRKGSTTQLKSTVSAVCVAKQSQAVRLAS